MTIDSILLPVFVQVGLIFIVCFWMMFARQTVLRSGKLQPGEVTSKPNPWPSDVRQISDSYRNQFEAPVLFFALVPLAIITRKADLVFVVMEWLFVLSRIVHAGIHTTSSNLQWRGIAFAIGIVVLFLMWLIFAVRILSVPVIR